MTLLLAAGPRDLVLIARQTRQPWLLQDSAGPHIVHPGNMPGQANHQKELTFDVILLEEKILLINRQDEFNSQQ